MTVRAAWLLPGGADPGQTREDTRLTPVGTMTPEGELTTRPGVIPGGDPFAATSAGAMSLQIGVGRGAVQGTAAQGAYPVAVTSPETLTFTDGGAQFPRVDSVVVHVYDGLYDISGETIARVEVVEGDPDALPSPPDLPAGFLRLWDVTVPAGASAGTGGIDWASALTDRRQYTVSTGGITPQGGAEYAGAYDGQYRDTGAGLERWSAADGAWAVYPPPAAMPLETRQTAEPQYVGEAVSHYFTEAQWKPITFTVPPSGAFFVTLSGQVSNRSTTAATSWLLWKATGGYTESDNPASGLSAQGGRIIASRRVLRTGVTPGVSVTITPGWNCSDAGGPDVYVRSGQLVVEPVAL
ncbi:hypothetical protein [Streptomyces anthocyanicus]|uniref:hypothetical protein n=1 Tax=Streptomyces anthocyanicus TaxID=68174 RepID=UPI0033C0F29F